VIQRIPSVMEQGINARFITHADCTTRNYNSGMAVVGGKTYLATRYFNRAAWRCDIVINELNGMEAKPVTQLKLPRAHGREWHEDARLFWHAGKLYCAYTEGQYWMRPWVAVQKLAVLREDWSVERVVTIGFGENSVGQEKNWQFFSHNGHLHFVYSIAPTHCVVALDDDYMVIGAHQTESGLKLPLRGGTPPRRFGDCYITFPHFHVEHEGHARRYAFSALTFEAKPPFRVEGVTEPLIWGSEHDGVILNAAYPHWNPLVVFPCGALLDGDTWMVSAGVNDSFDALFFIDNDDLKFLSA
jgi:hypothetical protein